MADAIVGTGHGLTTAEWSTSGASHAIGIIIDWENINTAEQEPIPNQAGGTAGTLFYDKGRRGTVTALIKNGQTLPATGSTVTLALPATGGGTITGYVDSEAKATGKIKAWIVATFVLIKKDAMTL